MVFMKTSFKYNLTTLALIIASWSALFLGWYFAPPDAPNGIKAIPPTEQSILQEMKREQREKEYKQASKIAAQVYRRLGCRPTYADGTGRNAVNFGVSARVLAALVYVESSCRSTAVSGRDSVGLTQINPRIWKYSEAELRDPNRNLEIGARILSGYIRRHGLREGLHAYNGFGNKTNSYATKVLTAAGLIS